MDETKTVMPAAKAPVVEDRSFVDLLKSLIGKPVTLVIPESYEDAPVGHQIRAGFNRAKPVAVGHDYLVCLTEFLRKGKKEDKEAVKQYIPISAIKRISVLKDDRLIHL